MDEATELKTHRALDHYDNFKFFLFTKNVSSPRRVCPNNNAID